MTVTVEGDYDDSDDICVIWEESAPSYQVPDEQEREGFGSRLLRMAVEGQLKGSFEREFADGGLRVRIAFPRQSIGN